MKPTKAFLLPSGTLMGYCKPCRLEVNQESRARHHDELLARRRAAYPSTNVYGWREHRRRWDQSTTEET